ncbi:LANO_0H08372g1_1 [Lachancea nothofagi CBS 11611]|uniref:LANO_0H08372g1_1 n=1 Tax=Lachancea nothofagi CBS 11611 TaxID=1266666 RepID=A0A1G4KM04_9SACH|nr:LANO_0H08372g1_1 [Lachancea nothofagi CBS 11611]
MRIGGPLLVALCSALAYCQPYEAFGANSQYPPVAVVGAQYSFQLSNDTFKSSEDDNAQIQYEAFALPSWLQFDSQSRVFSGTPSESDFDGDAETARVSYLLQGIDPNDNQSLNKTYQFALSKDALPEVSANFNLLSLLKNSGYTNGKNALKLVPGSVFNVSFDRDTFDNTSSSTSYYGRSTLYHAPLPNWVFFDKANLKFSGTAPVVNSEIAPEFSYSFSLLASDIQDYTGAEVKFELVVGAHQLTTSIQNTLAVNVSSTGSFSYPLPMSYIYLDGSPVSSSNVSSIKLLGDPDWATVSNQSLSGSLPKGQTSQNLTVEIEDVYGDSVYLNFLVESTHKLFAVSSLPNVNATQGEWFQSQLLPSQFTDYNNTDVSLDFTNTSQSTSWLSYHDSNMTLTGEVPDDFDDLVVRVTAKQASESQSLSFKLAAVQSKHTSSSSSSSASSSSTSHLSSTSRSSASSTSTASATSTSSAAPESGLKKASNKSNKTVAIACGVAIPVVVILALLILFLLLWRRRKNKSASAGDRENSPQISNPKLGNPANNPAFYGTDSPFGDEYSVDENASAKRLAVLNAMKLDEQPGSGSDNSTFDEKAECATMNSSSSDLYQDAMQTGSTDALLPPNENDQYFDSNKHTSSVYLNSEPTNRKSWRFSANNNEPVSNVRESYNSLNTVSTAELFNTQIANNKTLPKDPRKSSLGLRDSVFMAMPTNAEPNKLENMHSSAISPRKSNNASKIDFSGDRVLPNLSEMPQDQHSTNSHLSSSSSDDLVPIKNGDNYKWVERDGSRGTEPQRKRSVKRLVSLPNRSGVGVCDANEIRGQVPEIEASMDSNI